MLSSLQKPSYGPARLITGFENRIQSMKRRLALEPVAFSLIKETFQPNSLVADELLNVY